MAIKGAIFDCDGTLLDSMPMWTESCVGLLESYGVQDAMRVFLEHESLDMDKKCFWYHDNLGIGESGEALFRELWAKVERAYAETVRPYEGCAAFLEELKTRGVPCVIVSATPTELVRSALRCHGLMEYFEEILFVGDLGRGKEFSDCYLGAWKRLGTPREETWVFEDAPFGIRSAVRGGFPTVAIMNDHDGRDEHFVRRWATYVARSYRELSPRVLDGLGPRVTRALVVAGSPEPSSAELVGELARGADFVVAADAGVGILHEAGVAPDVYCGDEDSSDEEARAWARGHAGRIERHPVEKDDTDLALAVSCARDEAQRRGAALRLTVTCASGGRPDHMLGVWGVLAQNADAAPRLVEDAFESRVLACEGCDVWEIEGCEGATLSVVSLACGSRVTEHGMRWDLEDEELAFLSDRGVSNRITAKRASVRCHEGVVAVFLHKVCTCQAG